MNSIDQQFGLVHDCMRACIYTDYITKQKPVDGAWPSIMDMAYADAVNIWNQLFGTRSQETHWSKFVSKIIIPEGDKLQPFTKETILKFIKISDVEWGNFHKLMVDARNVRIVHLNVEKKIEELPNITWALHSVSVYRAWLIEALKMTNRNGYSIKITEQTGEEVIKTFESQIRNAYYCSQ